MGLSFMSIFSVFSAVGDWYKKAMEDGEVTKKELLQLGIDLAAVIGLQVAPDIVEEAKVITNQVLGAVDDAVDTTRSLIEEAETEHLSSLKRSQ